MPHLPRTAAAPHALHGATFHSFARSETGSRELCAWRTDFAPRTPGQPHSMSREEVLHVLGGTLEIRLGDELITAHQGDAVLVPADTTLTVGNATDEPAQAWVVTSRGMTATMAGGARLAPPWAQ